MTAREVGDDKDDLEGNWGGSFSTAGVVCTIPLYHYTTTIYHYTTRDHHTTIPLETSICRSSASCPTNKHSPLSSLGKEVKG